MKIRCEEASGRAPHLCRAVREWACNAVLGVDGREGACISQPGDYTAQHSIALHCWRLNALSNAR